MCVHVRWGGGLGRVASAHCLDPVPHVALAARFGGGTDVLEQNVELVPRTPLCASNARPNQYQFGGSDEFAGGFRRLEGLFHLELLDLPLDHATDRGGQIALDIRQVARQLPRAFEVRHSAAIPEPAKHIDEKERAPLRLLEKKPREGGCEARPGLVLTQEV